MSTHKIPKSLQEKLLTERKRLYNLLWQIEEGVAALVSGSVASYSLGNRSLTYQDVDKLKALQAETERRIEDIEAKLSHRSARNVSVNCFLDPSICLPRR